MPGFQVNTIGDKSGLGSEQEYIYTYTWKIVEIFGDRNDLIINAKDITLPTFSVGIETQQGASLEYKFAKKVSYDDIKITFYDIASPISEKKENNLINKSSGHGLLDVMRKWREQVWTPQGGLKTANEYKLNTQIDIFTPVGDMVTSWQLIGSWPSIIRHGELTYTSSDIKVVEVTITYDYALEWPTI